MIYRCSCKEAVLSYSYSSDRIQNGPQGLRNMQWENPVETLCE